MEEALGLGAKVKGTPKPLVRRNSILTQHQESSCPLEACKLLLFSDEVSADTAELSLCLMSMPLQLSQVYISRDRMGVHLTENSLYRPQLEKLLIFPWYPFISFPSLSRPSIYSET